LLVPCLCYGCFSIPHWHFDFIFVEKKRPLDSMC
jgi:hypothetical protein